MTQISEKSAPPSSHRGDCRASRTRALRNYLEGIGSILTSNCYDDMQVIYMEIDKLSSEVMKQSSQQLLASKSKAAGLGESKFAASSVTRPSTITLKSYLSWRYSEVEGFLALSASRLDKKSG